MTLTYNLPDDPNPVVFGPEFWKAFEDLASKIPCSICKDEGESFVSFWHDLKNFDLGKPIFNRDNFEKWLQRISLIAKENTSNKEVKQIKILLAIISLVVVTTLIITLFKK